MEIEELQLLLVDPEKLKQRILEEKEVIKGVEDVVKLLDINEHDVTKELKRPKRKIQTGTEDAPKEELQDVTRIAIDFQKKIVNTAAAFLCGNPIKLEANTDSAITEDMLSVLQKTWDDNKLDYESKGIAKKMFGLTEVAEVWYYEAADPDYWNETPNAGKKFRVRFMVLDPLKDSLYPTFNNAGDMIAFGRGYKTRSDGKEIEHFDLYTNEKTYFFEKGGDGFALIKDEINPVKKIPIIYYKQDLPEWYGVQSMIDRYEKSLSNHGDQNDYTGFPMIKVTGKIQSFAKKGETGKIIEMEKGGDASYMESSNAPESIKLEQENLRSLIFDMSDTPDVSFSQMKGLFGSAPAAAAIRLLFTSAHMKASDKEEVFGKSVQRRINYLKAALAVINPSLVKALPLSIKPKFEYFLPKNDTEAVQTLVSAVQGGIMSKETAIRLNPFVEDAEGEIERVSKEGLDTAIEDAP